MFTELEWEDFPVDDKDFEINNLRFVCTCAACPEQYDVFKENKQVAYVRLRWGSLSVDAPECGGTTIYSATYGDGFCGIFDPSDRVAKLTEIANKINSYYETTNT